MRRRVAETGAARLRAGVAAALAVVAVAAVLAACGGGSGGEGVATAGDNGAGPVVTGGDNRAGTAAPSGSGVPAGDLTAFARCLRDNGVDVSDPAPATGRLEFGPARRADPQAFQRAIQQCRHLMPAGALGAQLSPEQIEQLRQFAQCMREHGVDLPDPDPNAANLFGGGLAGIDRTSPAFRAAFDACRDRLPAGIADSVGGGS
jgi:hypothetical protein